LELKGFLERRGIEPSSRYPETLQSRRQEMTRRQCGGGAWATSAETIHHKLHKKHKGFRFPGLMRILPERRVLLAQDRGDEPRRKNWPRENLSSNGWVQGGRTANLPRVEIPHPVVRRAGAIVLAGGMVEPKRSGPGRCGPPRGLAGDRGAPGKGNAVTPRRRASGVSEAARWPPVRGPRPR